jgi:hypothetical protein
LGMIQGAMVPRILPIAAIFPIVLRAEMPVRAVIPEGVVVRPRGPVRGRDWITWRPKLPGHAVGLGSAAFAVQPTA